MSETKRLGGAGVAGAAMIRDLPDFVLRWKEFRPSVVKVLQTDLLRPEEKVILGWLVRMADKVTVLDLQE